MTDFAALAHELALLAHPGTIAEYGVTFQSGRPVSFEYWRNPRSAPYLGTKYQQDIEPGGQYVTHRYPLATPFAGIETGVARVQHPLVMAANTEPGAERDYDDHSWKARLWQVIKPYIAGRKRGVTAATARRRAEAIRAMLLQAGFDAIVVVAPHGSTPPHTTEIVLLDPQQQVEVGSTLGAVPNEEDFRLVDKRVMDEQDREQARILIEEADPSRGRPRFAVWLTSLITQREADGRRQLVNAKEDAAKVREVLDGYLSIRRENRLHRLAELLGRSTDLNHPVNDVFITYRELRDAVRQLLGKSKSILDVEEQIRKGHARVLLDWPDIEILEVSKVEGCPVLFAETDWCVRFEDTAGDYLIDGNLFLFRVRDDDDDGSGELENMALVYYGGGLMVDQMAAQFMDVNDDPLYDMKQIAGAIAWIGSLGQRADPPLRINDDSLVARLMYVLFLSPKFGADLTLEHAMPEAGILPSESMTNRVQTAIRFLEATDIYETALSYPPDDPHNRDIRSGVLIRYSPDYLTDDYVEEYVADSLEETRKHFADFIDELLLDPHESPAMSGFIPPDEVVDELRGIFYSLRRQPQTLTAMAQRIKKLWQHHEPDIWNATTRVNTRISEEIPLIEGYLMQPPMTDEHLEQLIGQLELLNQGGLDSKEARSVSGVMKDAMKELLAEQYAEFLGDLREMK